VYTLYNSFNYILESNRIWSHSRKCDPLSALISRIVGCNPFSSPQTVQVCQALRAIHFYRATLC